MIYKNKLKVFFYNIKPLISKKKWSKNLNNSSFCHCFAVGRFQ